MPRPALVLPRAVLVPVRAAFVLPLLLGLACRHGSPVSEGPPLSDDERAQAERLVAVAEVDPGRIKPDQQRRLLRLALETKCPCPGVPGNLAECATAKVPCLQGPFAVRALLRGVDREEPDAVIVGRLLERFGPREPEAIDLSAAPCRGRDDAPVVLVVFSDFECPFCALGAQLLVAVEHEAGERLRVCFKHWPLTHRHKKAELAARAAAAAQVQGKFWPMHDRLFLKQKELDAGDLEEHAKDLGLDLARFRRDLDSDEMRGRVRRDAAEAERLSLGGTPSFLINGKRMTDPKTVPDFLDWIAEAIAIRRAEAAAQATASQPASGPAASRPAVR